MAQQKQYISTDPNFGMDKQYASTDPNFGLDQKPAAPPSSNDGFLQSLWNQVNPLTLLKGVGSSILHPLDTISNITTAQRRAQEAALGHAVQMFLPNQDSTAHGLQALRFGIGGAVPGLGPALMPPGDKMIAGNTAGALGDVAGIVGGFAEGEGLGKLGQMGARQLAKVAPYAAEAAMKVPTGVKNSFPTQPGKVLMDENIFPFQVPARMDAIENQLKQTVGAADAARPRVAGYLGPGTYTEHTPTGFFDPDTTVRMDVQPAASRSNQFRFEEAPGGGAPYQIPRSQFLGVPRDTLSPPSGFGGPGVLQRELPYVGSPGSSGIAPQGMIAPRDIATSVNNFVNTRGAIPARPLDMAARSQLDDLLGQYLDSHQVPESNLQGLASKRISQKIASYEDNPTAVNELFHEGMANAYRRSVGENAPGSLDLLGREQGLLGVQKTLEHTRNLPFNSGGRMVIDALGALGGHMLGGAEGGIAGLLGAEALRSPNIMAGFGLGLKHLPRATQPISQLSPYLQLLAQQQQKKGSY